IPCLLHDQFPSTHQSLFVGKGNPLTLPNGCHGGAQSYHTHHSCHHSIGTLQLCRLQQPVHATAHMDGSISQAHPQVIGCLFLHHHNQFRGKFSRLLFHPCHIGVGSQSPHRHATGFHHLQCLFSNRTR